MKTKTEFLAYFHGLAGVDPSLTNHALIDFLFEPNKPQLTRYRCGRNRGVTTTLVAFAQWIDLSVLAIVRNGDAWDPIKTRTWRESIIGLRPRPELLLIDNPQTREEHTNAVIRAKFRNYLKRLPYPAIYIHNTEES